MRRTTTPSSTILRLSNPSPSSLPLIIDDDEYTKGGSSSSSCKPSLSTLIIALLVMVNISIYLQRVSPSSSSVPSSPPLTSSTVNPSTSSYQSTIVAAREVLRSTAERTKDLADEARVITDRTREALHLGGGEGGGGTKRRAHNAIPSATRVLIWYFRT